MSDKGEPYNPNDPTIWYNQPRLRKKVEKIKQE